MTLRFAASSGWSARRGSPGPSDAHPDRHRVLPLPSHRIRTRQDLWTVSERRGGSDRSVDGGAGTSHERPVAVTIRPMPPLAGIVHEALFTQSVGQEVAITPCGLRQPRSVKWARPEDQPVTVRLCGPHPDVGASPRSRSNPYTTSLDATLRTAHTHHPIEAAPISPETDSHKRVHPDHRWHNVGSHSHRITGSHMTRYNTASCLAPAGPGRSGPSGLECGCGVGTHCRQIQEAGLPALEQAQADLDQGQRVASSWLPRPRTRPGGHAMSPQLNQLPALPNTAAGAFSHTSGTPAGYAPASTPSSPTRAPLRLHVRHLRRHLGPCPGTLQRAPPRRSERETGRPVGHGRVCAPSVNSSATWPRPGRGTASSWAGRGAPSPGHGRVSDFV